MKKMVGAMALGVVLAAGSVTAAEAAPKSYTVTAKVSKSSSAVGQTIRVSGKVTGQSAKHLRGDRVTIQRKYTTGGWRKVGTAKIKSNRTFALSVKLTAGGDTSFRVVKPKSGKVRSGTSAVRTLAVYKWINLTTAPQVSFAIGMRNAPVTMLGKRYPRALQGVGTAFSAFRTAGKCQTVTTYTGFVDHERAELPDDHTQTLQISAASSIGGGPVLAGEFVTPVGSVAKRTARVSGAEYVLMAAEADGATAVMALPLMYCNLNQLPTLPDSFFAVS